jgi:hypothetical protein
MSRNSQADNLFPGVTIEGGFIPGDALQDLDASGRISAKGGRGNTPDDFLSPASFDIFPPDSVEASCQRAYEALRPRWLQFDRFRGQVVPRWLSPLLHELHFGNPSPVTLRLPGIDSKEYQFSGLHGSVPVLLVEDHTHDLDKPFRGKASPHGLMQEFLNKSKDHLFGIVSNGMELRLLRDNARLTRQAYISFDLAGIFSGAEYASFSLLYRLLHGSRFRVGHGKRPEDCLLEGWLKKAGERTARAMENLRDGVRKAIEELGRGFLCDPSIASAIREGDLTAKAFNHELLRLVYRFLFLLVAEERNLLFAPGVDEGKREIYNRGYSIGRLRQLARQCRGGNHHDLYESIKVTFTALADSAKAALLGLTALGGLFNAKEGDRLPRARLANDHLLAAMRHLTLREADGQLRPIDFLRLGAEELGSVYEQLLQLEPYIDLGNPVQPGFEITAAAGNERKVTGSYYTPDSLVQCLLDSALEPVMAQAVNGKIGEEAAQTLLKLTICDPACGSGHFLVSAGRRLAQRVAEFQAGGELPSAAQVRNAFRQVVARCLFGVDINPMAVELAKIALWMEAMEPGKPLSFLDHHFRVGNSLLGVTPRLLAEGLPDDTFTPIFGDDRAICTDLKRRNKEERDQGQRELEFGTTVGDMSFNLTNLDQGEDDTLEQVLAKERQFQVLATENEYRISGRLLADAWCAAFVWHKAQTADDIAQNCPTTAILREILKKSRNLALTTYIEIRRLAAQYQFFHWHLEFPNIFKQTIVKEQYYNTNTGWNGGFDVVVGNPPWEKVKLQEREFFSTVDNRIAEARTAAIRKKLIAEHEKTNSSEWKKYCTELRLYAAHSHILRHSNLYPLTSSGEANTYSLFAELTTNIVSVNGRVGQILKTGIVNAVENVQFFVEMVHSRRLVSIRDFKNWLGWFPDIGYHERFSLVTLSGLCVGEECTYAFNCLNIEEANDPKKIYKLSQEDIDLLNPNIPVCPVFSTSRDVEITKNVYLRTSVLVNEKKYENNWGIEYRTMFHMTSDSGEFNTYEYLNSFGFKLGGDQVFASDDDIYIPMLEGKHIQIFTHRFGTFEGVLPAERFGIKAAANAPSATQLNDPKFEPMPRYWVSNNAFKEHSPESLRDAGWCIAFRGITNLISNARTVICAAVPARAFGNSVALLYCIKPENHKNLIYLLGILNSIPLDFFARQKLFGSNLNKYIMWQLPIPSHDQLREMKLGKIPWTTFALPRLLELIYVTDSLSFVAKTAGYQGPPFQWDDDRRHMARCELDASLFIFYGVLKGDISYILDSFPIVISRELEKNGEYLTKRLILEIYEEMQEAMRTGKPYQTRLDPPPGPPTNPDGTFATLPDWKVGAPKPANWPSHIHPPRGVHESH